MLSKNDLILLRVREGKKNLTLLFTTIQFSPGYSLLTLNHPWHSSVLELRKNQFLKKINILKTFLEIETTHYLEGLDLKLSNETYAKDSNL